MLPHSENMTVEFKASFTDDVILALTAFANAKGGSVYVGVEDNGNVKGVEIAKETISNWINTIKSKTTPSIIPDVEIIEIESKHIAVLQISEYPIKPVSFRDRYYKRVGNSNHQLDAIEITNLNLQSLQVSWDSYPKHSATIDDIDLSKVEKFIDKVNSKGRFRLEKTLLRHYEN